MRRKIDCLGMRCLAMLFLVFICTGVFAQTQVTGKVTSGTDNAPLGYATVAVKGTKVATLTNADGTFSLTMPTGRTTLVVSSVGYEDQEVEATSGTVNVTMKAKTSALDEIVVTGYTAQKKKEVTGAVSVVNVKEMKQQPAGTGEDALQGRASGVNIISSGQPGYSADIRIRGFSGFGNNQPLIIVDGVRGDLHNINVNDIESLQVLKDASAAIYGVAGSNGVIIITTKRGKSGKAVIAYDGYYGVTTPGSGVEMATPEEHAAAIWQQQLNSGIHIDSIETIQYGSGTSPVIPDYLTPAGYTLCNCPADSVVDIRFYNRETNQITMANKTGTNWYDAITRSAPTQSHNISVSSGSDKSSYYFSMNYLNQQGILQYQFLERYGVRANTQFTIKNHIRVGENAYVYWSRNPTVRIQNEGNPFTFALREDPIIPIYDIAGNFAGTKSQDLGNSQNPYANAYRTKDNKNNNWNVEGNVYAEVDFLKHFTARSSFGGVMNNNYGYGFTYVGYENAEGNTGLNSFSENAGYNTQWTFTNTLTYGNTFGQHTIRGLIGIEAVNYYGRNLSGTRSDYFSEDPNFWTLNTGSPSGQVNTGSAYQSALFSQFAKLEYNYAGKYLLNGTIRRDGSSLFTPEQRYGYFPSVSAGWVISQENFMKSLAFINSLKLRYSWGKMGSTSAVQATNAYNLYRSSAGRSFYDIRATNTTPMGGFYASNLGNPATSWEGDIISNVGIDATIFNNKFDITVDWYKKKVSGLLFQASGTQYDILFTGDVTLPQVNVGDMQNTGIDGSVTYHGNISKDFKFDLTGTFTSYNNKIVDVPDPGYFDGPLVRNVILQRNQEGHAVGAFYGYRVIGLFQGDQDISNSPIQDGAKPGFFKYQDIDGNDTVDARDRTFIGNPNPKFSYGLNISFSYKALDFSAFFFGSAGNDIYNNTLYFTDFPDFFKGAIRRDVALNAWTPEHTNTNIPALRTTGSFSSDAVTNSYFLSKGSYLRARQMQIGYTLPASLLNRYGIDRLRIYVQGANLFTITKYNGLDPELQRQDPTFNTDATIGFGTDQGTYPHTPSYLVGVNLSF